MGVSFREASLLQQVSWVLGALTSYLHGPSPNLLTLLLLGLEPRRSAVSNWSSFPCSVCHAALQLSWLPGSFSCLLSSLAPSCQHAHSSSSVLLWLIEIHQPRDLYLLLKILDPFVLLSPSPILVVRSHLIRDLNVVLRGKIAMADVSELSQSPLPTALHPFCAM